MVKLELSEEEEEEEEKKTKKRRKLTSIDHAISGGISGCITRFVCQPLDVIKIRFQLQVEPISRKSTNSMYWSIIQAGRRIVRYEGITALWKGHVPAQFLSITYGSVQFVTYESLTNHMQNLSSDAKKYQSTIYFVSGAAAGCLATLVSFPFDVARTRLVAQGTNKIYKGVLHGFYRIYTKEGFRVFYKGLSPTLLQVAPHAGVQFATFKMFQELILKVESEEIKVKVPSSDECSLEAVSFSGNVLCGSLAGACAKTAVYPLDVARKRLQIQGFEEARIPFGQVFRCNGLWQCLVRTVKHERLSGLYKGFTPSLLKAATTTAFHFSLYDATCHLLKDIRNWETARTDGGAKMRHAWQDEE